MPRLLLQLSDSSKNHCLGSIVSGHAVKEYQSSINKACKTGCYGISYIHYINVPQLLFIQGVEILSRKLNFYKKKVTTVRLIIKWKEIPCSQ